MKKIDKREERSLYQLLHDMGEEYESFLAESEELLAKIKEGNHAQSK